MSLSGSRTSRIELGRYQREHFIAHEPLQALVKRAPIEATLSPPAPASRQAGCHRHAKRPLFLADHDAFDAPQRHVATTDCDANRSSNGRAQPFGEPRDRRAVMARPRCSPIEAAQRPFRSRRSTTAAIGNVATPSPWPRLEPGNRLSSCNDEVERPLGTAIFEALYQSRPLQPIVRTAPREFARRS
jgi:hypothetical protein